jgi:hypothetical protein
MLAFTIGNQDAATSFYIAVALRDSPAAQKFTGYHAWRNEELLFLVTPGILPFGHLITPEKFSWK